MTKIFVALAALSASLTLVSPAHAQTPPAAPAAAPAAPQNRWEAPCKADIEKLCKADKDVRGCLTTHEKELTPDCQKPLRQTNIQDACSADFDRLCKEEKAQGKLSQCITDKKAQLTDGCKSVLDRSAKVTTVTTVTTTKPAPKKKGKKK
jgi:hypothetical protein